MTTRTRITATPLYPGSLFPEDGTPVPITDTSTREAVRAVPDDGSWFAVEVAVSEQNRWTDGEGGELWRTAGTPKRHRVYVGTPLTADDLRARPNPEQYDILISNMRGNDWPRVVETRRGNFAPIERDDVVLTNADLAAMLR